jgi:hypothetical protein
MNATLYNAFFPFSPRRAEKGEGGEQGKAAIPN